MTTDQIKYLIIETAKSYGTSALQCLAQAKAESGFDQSAISPAGAIGVFQLMPGTARDLGVDPYNLEQNIQGGVRYVKQCNNWFPGRIDLALSAYNWGIGNTYRMIWSVNGQPIAPNAPIPKPPTSMWPDTQTVMNNVVAETRGYIDRVVRFMTELQNDPVYLASGEGGDGGGPDWGMGEADLKTVAALVVGALLVFALLRR